MLEIQALPYHWLSIEFTSCAVVRGQRWARDRGQSLVLCEPGAVRRRALEDGIRTHSHGHTQVWVPTKLLDPRGSSGSKVRYAD
jgi:hypothetical protein